MSIKYGINGFMHYRLFTERDSVCGGEDRPHSTQTCEGSKTCPNGYTCKARFCCPSGTLTFIL